MSSKPSISLDNSSIDPEEAHIVDRIFTAVMEQRLAPNTKLSEPKLCETFGVGRMRVRRALLLLAAQGNRRFTVKQRGLTWLVPAPLKRLKCSMRGADRDRNRA